MELLYGRKASRLELYRAKLTPEALPKLADELAKHSEISALVLDFCDFRKGHAAQLKDFLKALKHINTLSLRCLKLDKEGYNALAAGFHSSQQLVTLDLYGLGFTAPTLALLASALATSFSLQSLDLSSNQMTLEMTKILSDGLLKKSQKLAKLMLDSSSIDANNIAPLCEGLRASKSIASLVLSNNLFQSEEEAKCVGLLLEETQKLEHLDLSQVFFSTKSWAVLGHSLATNISLRALILDSNKIERDDFKPLAEGLAKQKGLRELSLVDNALEEGCGEGLSAILGASATLETLNLKCNFLGEKGVIPVLQQLRHNFTVKILNLRKNQLKVPGGRAIAEYLKDPAAAVEDLDLSCNELADAGVSLADALRQNKTLRKLNLTDNILADDFAQGFSDMIKENETLEVVQLENNNISNEGAQILAAGVQFAKGLHTLNLESNTLTQFGALTILRARLLNIRVKVISSEVKQFITSLT